MTDEATPSLDETTQVIAGRYEVIGLLGVGGMGAVYKVRDRELDEVVALKMLKRDIANTTGMVERFRREVKLARRVTHPNVARTFDLGEHRGERFLTMELVEGESLASRVAREGQLSIASIVEIVGGICAGLEAAHAAGVIHRDLKPDNVLLAPHRVVITDFGIARAAQLGEVSRTAVPVGTPAYMAPEQVEASPDIDARADVYALGAMLFELLTGHLPFEADSVFAVAAMRLTHPPPDPRVHCAELPESIALLVQRCMARKPQDRPQHVREIASRLASMTLPAADALARSGESRAVSYDTPDDDGQKTVAVLPLRNAGPPEDDYLVDGLTDDLIDALSMTPGLRVRPRGVVMQHKNATSDSREIGRELNVQVVVEGTMRTAADAIRVSARVLSVDDGFQIWAKRFEGTRSDVLRIGDDAAREVAAALAVRKPTRAAIMTDPIAMDLYLRGRHEYLKFWSSANQRAIELLKAAHERAPTDALIMAGYASALSRQFGITELADQSDAARKIAENAVRIAPQLADGHVALAYVRLHEPDPVAAAAGVVRALALSPLSPDAHELRARILTEVAEPAEAIAAAERTLQLEPRHAHLRYSIIARSHAFAKDWDAVARVLGPPPTDDDEASLYWLARSRFLLWKQAPDEVPALIEAATRVKPFPTLPLLRITCEMMTSRTISELMRAALQERQRAAPTKRMRVYWYQLTAETYAYVGDYRAALVALESSVALGLFDLAWMDRCPLLEPLRAESAFVELRNQVARRAYRVITQLRGGDATLAS